MPAGAPVHYSGSTGSASNVIWTSWNDSYTSTSATLTPTTLTTGGSGNGIIWTLWSNQYATTTLVTSGTLSPNTTALRSDQILIGNQIWTGWVGQQNLTAEQCAARDRQVAEYQAQHARQQEEYRQRQLVIAGEQAQARERAELILQEHLSAEQKAQLKDKNYFELDTISKNGERRRYRIERKWSGSVHRVDPNGKVVKTLCIHPREVTPIEDSMLAQKLMLEGGMEEELLRIANHWN